MRKIILITAFLSLFITPSFSQIENQLSIKPNIENIHRKPFTFEMGRENKGLFSYSTVGLQQFIPSFLSKNLFLNYNQSKLPVTTKYNDRMPCYNPQGYFPIKVFIFDNSKRCSLLIKDV